MTDIHSHVDAYVVGALSTAEILDFEAHLTECVDCRKEVAEMRDLAAELSAAVAATPPPALRSLILAQIATTPQERPMASPGAHRSDVTSTGHLAPAPAPTASVSPEPQRSNVIPLTSRRPNRASGLLAAASLLVAATLGGWALKSSNDAEDAQQLAAKNEQVVQILAAGDARAVSTSIDSGGSATIVMSPTAQQAVLVSAGLPALPDGKVYEAWTIKRVPQPAGTFDSGSSPSVLQLPDATFDATKVAVTIEPAGGSDAPTGEVVAALDLPRT